MLCTMCAWWCVCIRYEYVHISFINTPTDIYMTVLDLRTLQWGIKTAFTIHICICCRIQVLVPQQCADYASFVSIYVRVYMCIYVWNASILARRLCAASFWCSDIARRIQFAMPLCYRAVVVCARASSSAAIRLLCHSPAFMDMCIRVWVCVCGIARISDPTLNRREPGAWNWYDAPTLARARDVYMSLPTRLA